MFSQDKCRAKKKTYTRSEHNFYAVGIIKKQAKEIQMLVSIIVITYNSSRYVLETLESAYRQTYADIELIVSDDCSTDNTFTLCQEWVEAHKDRFVRTLCTQTPHNIGVTDNCNHALNQIQGKWLKIIAGDDILSDNCIERFVQNISPTAFIYSCTSEQIEMNGFKNPSTPKQSQLQLIGLTARQQIRSILKYHYLVPGSSLFFEWSHLVQYGGFDSQFKMVEDWPIVMKYLTNNQRLHIINESLVLWRNNDDSITHTSAKPNSQFQKDIKKAIRYYFTHYCWRYGLFFYQYHYTVSYWIEDHHNKHTFYTIAGYFLRCFDAIHLKNKIFKRIKASC